ARDCKAGASKTVKHITGALVCRAGSKIALLCDYAASDAIVATDADTIRSLPRAGSIAEFFRRLDSLAKSGGAVEAIFAAAPRNHRRKPCGDFFAQTGEFVERERACAGGSLAALGVRDRARAIVSRAFRIVARCGHRRVFAKAGTHFESDESRSAIQPRDHQGISIARRAGRDSDSRSRNADRRRSVR